MIGRFSIVLIEGQNYWYYRLKRKTPVGHWEKIYCRAAKGQDSRVINLK